MKMQYIVDVVLQNVDNINVNLKNSNVLKNTYKTDNLKFVCKMKKFLKK